MFFHFSKACGTSNNACIQFFAGLIYKSASNDLKNRDNMNKPNSNCFHKWWLRWYFFSGQWQQLLLLTGVLEVLYSSGVLCWESCSHLHWFCCNQDCGNKYSAISTHAVTYWQAIDKTKSQKHFLKENKYMHVWMKPSQISPTSWEWHHNTFSPPLHLAFQQS